MQNDEQNKNDDAFYFNKVILGDRKIKKETKELKLDSKETKHEAN